VNRYPLWLLAIAVSLGACQLTIQEEKYPAVSHDRPLVEAEKAIPYQRFLILMDGEQRQAFFAMRTTKDRDRFLKENGLTIRRMLADNLRRGMSTQAVEKTLGRPHKEWREEHSVLPTERFLRVVDEWWIYQRPETGNLVFIPFRKGWVVDWLLDPEIRALVHKRPTDEAGRIQKQKALIHMQERMPDLLRNPGEDREDYHARMKRVAPILISEGPPTWPQRLPAREQTADFIKERVNKQEVYSCWGDTSKLYESPPDARPKHYFATHTRWTYKRFNGYGYVYYSLYFHDNRLMDWVVETGLEGA